MPTLIEQNILPVRQKIYRFAYSLTGNVQDAEDIVQDVFEKVWKARHEQSEQVANWEAWCMTLTRNRSIDKQRANAVRRSESVDEHQQTFDTELLPDARAEQNDILQQVKSKMDQLPEKQRSVMHLRDVEEMSYEEIGQILDISIDQVKVNLHRARKTLREQLLDHNPIPLIMTNIVEIKDLLEKYWEGDTSVAEERLLKQYFNSTDIAPELARFAPLFQVLVAEQKVVSTSLNPTTIATVATKPKTFSFYQYAAAASVAMLVCVGLTYLNLPKEQTAQIAAIDMQTAHTVQQETTPEPATLVQPKTETFAVSPQAAAKKTIARKSSKKPNQTLKTTTPDTAPTAEELEAAYALQETRKALELIAATFNKGKSSTSSALKATEVLDPFFSNPSRG